MNKTESRVELLWSPRESDCLSEAQKLLIKDKLGSRITDEGLLILVSERFRSQHRNREDVSERFLDLIMASLAPAKKRKPTRPTRSSIEKRIREKKIRGDLKKSRRNGPGE